MNVNNEAQFVMVPLREATVAQLISLRKNRDESLDRIVTRLTTSRPSPDTTGTPPATTVSPVADQTSPIRQKHEAVVLGELVGAPTLGKLFAAVVDVFAALDSTVLDRLAETKARTRPHIARQASEVHPGRPDLPVLRTLSGWWVSANVGVEDVKRSIIALCNAGRLRFGTDVRFPAR